jgi:hypothetical protein
MKKLIFPSLLMAVLTACTKETPPISVNEFLEKPRLLEAAMVRCAEERSRMKYEAECVNAREAVNRLEARRERLRREERERQSELKREALRRTQEAAAVARQRALEEERRRKEDEYLGLFETDNGGGESPPKVTESAEVPPEN